MKAPSKVIIVGGTHGNEWTGIKIVNHYQDYLKNKYPQITLEFIFANPEAYELNSRFKDEDLNRAFQFLNEDKKSYESIRAKEIKKIIDEEHCLVIDLHTTTANMGKTIILSHYNSFNLSLCARLGEQMKDLRIIGAPDPSKKYLASQTDFGLILEIGPVANNVVDPSILESTLQLVELILEQMSASLGINNGHLEVYEEARDVHYPLNEKGELNGYIHSDFQGKDFLALKNKFKAFKTYQQVDIEVETKEELYPIFINEAAYYPQHLAFTLCRKKKLVF
jgi:aspartoacylase